MDFTSNWVVTDPSTNQMGRFISSGLYEFKEDNIEPRIIDLTKFKSSTVDKALLAFGYSLREPIAFRKEINLWDIYKTQKEVDWICAECLFELEIGEDFCPHPIDSRVNTHRGVHCGDCGKRF